MNLIPIRRVRWKRLSLHEQVEVVCLCPCHTRGGMHIRPCCHEPHTSAGEDALKNFKEEHDSHR